MRTHAHRHELLTVKEAAERLRLHPMTVRRMIDAGHLRAFQLGEPGSAIRVDALALERLLTPKEITA